MAKSKAQEAKQKKATEKRKKTEKAVLRIAAAMPEEEPGEAGGSRGLPPKPGPPPRSR